MKKVTFFCGGKEVPASRFRVDPVADYLSHDGWCVKKIYGYGPLDHHLGNSIIRKGYRASCRLRRAVKTARWHSQGPVVVQRLAWPWSSIAEQKLAQRTDGFVFDFDDAVFLGGNGKISFSRDRALKKIFSLSDKIVAGNSWLANYASDFGDVTIIPTCIDTEKYSPKSNNLGDTPVIGWIGTSGNFPYLEQLIVPLKKLRKDGLKFTFLICSDVINKSLFNSLNADFVKWSSEREVAILQSLDIGLMPLFDDDWCKGKCSFKIIQYSSVGVPSIGSAVGFNNDVILDEKTGYLVKNFDWYSPIRTLLEDSGLRKKMGNNARSRMIKNYDIRSAGKQYKKILENFS